MYIGFDHHKNFSYVTVMDEKGQVLKQQKIVNDKSTLSQFMDQLKDEKVYLALEAGRDWYWVYDLLEKKEAKVSLAHPKKTKAIASARIKTDRIDSTILAHLLRTNLLPASYIPNKKVREILRAHIYLVKLRTSIKNRIHSILAKNGIFPTFTDLFGKKGMKFLTTLRLPFPFDDCLKSHLIILNILEEER